MRQTMKLWMLAAILLLGPMSGCHNGKDGNANVAETADDMETKGCPFVGAYLDEDNGEPNLFVACRDSDDKYSVEIGIFRLTTLDDGVGTLKGDVLEFTATDASGNPIGGEIALTGDTAVVTFTHSTWPLLENGSHFRYVRQKETHSINGE